MNSKEMELQAIKEKLQRVRQEPLSAEAATLPWVPTSRPLSPNPPPPNEGRGEATSIRPGVHQSVHQYAATVETLKQRSSQHLQAFTSGSQKSYTAASPGTESVTSPYPSPSTQPWEIEIQLQALAQQAAQINQLSEQQEAAMLAMKAITDRLAFEGYDVAAWNEQNVFSGTMSAVPCEFQAAIVPMVQQTRRGTYVLSYRDVDLYRDHRQAQELAGNLRGRQQDAGFNIITQVANLDWVALSAKAVAGVRQRLYWVTTRLGRTDSAAGRSAKSHLSQGAHRQSRPSQPRSRLTPLDGLIWFSGAAIIRICLDFVIAKNPVLFPYVAILMLGIGLFVLYRATLARRPNYTLGFRLLIVIAGLVVGGRL